MSNRETTMEAAEQGVFDLCEKFGEDFAYVSDTGTVENLLDAGFTMYQIASGDIHRYAFISNVYNLD
jgi:sialic acid synthase SpsE